MREMKDSGVEWIGEIPKDWEAVKSKYMFSVVNGATPRSDEPDNWEGNIVWVTPTDMKQPLESLTISEKNITEVGLGSCGTTIVPRESIVLSTRAPIGKIAFAGVDLCTNQGCKALVAKKDLSSRFIGYYLFSISDFLVTLGRGTTFIELSTYDLLNLRLPYPTKTQQDKALAYLDAKCAQIDRAIVRQQEVIEKLKEYKLSVITEAVTKGLNPDVPMKDSGIEWIGEIPEHWVIGTVGNGTTKIGSGKTPRGGSEVYIDEGILFIRSQNVYETGLQLDDAVYISEEIDNEMSNTRVIKDDVLLNITGGSIGRACIYPFADKKANVNQHVCIIRTDIGSVLPKYMLYLWNSYIGKTSIDLNQTGANREGMNFMQIAQTAIPFLPIQEQEEIVRFLEKRCKEIEDVISRKFSLIDKLTEYKKSLIYEVVTGKREV